MATFTAYILIGHGHPNDDGIIPTAELALSENSRPSRTLTARTDASRHGEPVPLKRRVWIPSSPENILEDGLLMSALYVWRHPAVRRQAQALFDLKAPRQDLTEIDASSLATLRDMARSCPWPGKLAFLILADSYLLNQLEKLEPWSIEAEVCTPQWWRIQNQWDPTPRIGGTLSNMTGGR